MNREDSIEILKNSKKLYLKEKIDSDILEEAIETLLTAYEKEKEKREKLEYEATEAEEYIKELRKYIEKYKIRIPMPEEYYNRENWGEEIIIAQKEYIAVDKIKAKIGKRMQKNNNTIHNAKLKYGKDYVYYDDVQEAKEENRICKEILQSLLEKE